MKTTTDNQSETSMKIRISGTMAKWIAIVITVLASALGIYGRFIRIEERIQRGVEERADIIKRGGEERAVITSNLKTIQEEQLRQALLLERIITKLEKPVRSIP